MFCVNCRAQISPNTNFCPVCGSRQNSVPVQTAPCRPQPVNSAPAASVPAPAPVFVQSPAPQIMPDSVFDFSMMSSQAAAPIQETTTTGMTPRQRNARKKSSGVSRKTAAAIISAAAVLILAAAIVIMNILPGIMTQQSLTKAREYMDSGSYELAADEYDKVIAADPDNVEAYSGKADSLKEQGKLKEAADVLREGYKRTSSYLLSSRCDEIEAQLYGG